VAITGSARGATSRQTAAPRIDEAAEQRRRLTVVPSQKIKPETERRRARAMLLLATVFLVGGIFVVGMGQNLLGTQQIRLDYLQSHLASATQTNENLLLNRAQLEAPARILQLAEHRLGMITPQSVVYLTPVIPGPTVADKGKESIGVKR